MRNIISIGGEFINTVNNHKRNLTYEKFLFLHLLRNNYIKDNYIVPESITEKGIQKVLNCNLGHISRILKKNEKKGNIYRKLLRIEYRKRKQFAFFLTPKGIKVAEKFKNEFRKK
jgi:DNA-binding MarR family transcriptional regulator